MAEPNFSVSEITPISALYNQIVSIDVTVTNIGLIAISLASVELPSSRWEILSNGCMVLLEPGASCVVTVNLKIPLNSQTHSLGWHFLANNASQTAADKTQLIESIAILPGVASVEKVYPLNGNSWNDYVSRSDKSKNENIQPDVNCVPKPLPVYSDCLHAGEKLKVLTGLSSCTDLSITESLGVFQWKCDDSSGEAIFYSNQLKVGKGLKDLVNANSWKSNSVSISSSSTQILQSTPQPWWGNTVQALPDASSSGVSLSTSGTIYTYSVDIASRGYTIGASKIAIVGLNNAKINRTAGNGSIIFSGYSFAWIEAHLKAGTGIYLSTGYNPHTRIHNSKFESGNYGIQNALGGGIVGSIIDNSNFANLTLNGIKSDNHFSGNLVYSTFFSNIGSYCVDAWLATNTKYIQLQCVNSFAGLHSKYGGSLAAVSISNILNIGYYQDYNEDKGIINNLFVAKGAIGLSFSGGGFGEFDQLYSQIAVAANTSYGINGFTNQTLKNKFTNSLLVSTGTCNALSVNLPALGLVNGTCTSSGTDVSSTYPAGYISDAVLRIGQSLASAIIGKTMDTINPEGSNSSTPFASITNWFDFENPYRAWAVSTGTNSLDGATTGPCTSGSCSITDFTLHTSSPFRYATGDGSAGSASVLVNNATCPAVVHGNQVTYTLEIVPRAFLTNAFEIPISAVGNHDGLCESGEECIYTPHFGAYQGLGDFYSNECHFQNGIVKNVILYGYPL